MTDNNSDAAVPVIEVGAAANETAPVELVYLTGVKEDKTIFRFLGGRSDLHEWHIEVFDIKHQISCLMEMMNAGAIPHNQAAITPWLNRVNLLGQRFGTQAIPNDISRAVADFRASLPE